ncbi:unnamed protein product [Caenorhabditis auriculariae]|uniref:Uncharacterized protein n=1 Tax=Caenorhabditis auriculariae TaxID=2777116 RepID=A0A8S1HNB8_9PELO|nr:unnamed protein product [Caenorhabditis auriculariae]
MFSDPREAKEYYRRMSAYSEQDEEYFEEEISPETQESWPYYRDDGMYTSVEGVIYFHHTMPLKDGNVSAEWAHHGKEGGAHHKNEDAHLGLFMLKLLLKSLKLDLRPQTSLPWWILWEALRQTCEKN